MSHSGSVRRGRRRGRRGVVRGVRGGVREQRAGGGVRRARPRRPLPARGRAAGRPRRRLGEARRRGLYDLLASWPRASCLLANTCWWISACVPKLGVFTNAF